MKANNRDYEILSIFWNTDKKNSLLKRETYTCIAIKPKRVPLPCYFPSLTFIYIFLLLVSVGNLIHQYLTFSSHTILKKENAQTTFLPIYTRLHSVTHDSVVFTHISAQPDYTIISRLWLLLLPTALTEKYVASQLTGVWKESRLKRLQKRGWMRLMDTACFYLWCKTIHSWWCAIKKKSYPTH